MNKGSVLVLTLIMVLLLSVMVTGLMTSGETETATAQNQVLKRTTYYAAVKGVESIRNQIYNTPDASSVTALTKSASSTRETDGGASYCYITGSLYDMLNGGGTGKPLTQFTGFDAPTLQGISLGGTSSISSIVWKVNVTSQTTVGSKKAYSEILTGVYSIAVVGY